MWYDNYRPYIREVDPHNPHPSLSVTASRCFAHHRATTIPLFAYLDAVAQALPPVVAYVLRYVGLLVQRSTISEGRVLRTWFSVPLYLARTAVLSLKWRPFLPSELKFGTHVELLEFVRELECQQLKTRRMVPCLIDMKIFYAFLKMSYGAIYSPSHVDQFLFGTPINVWNAAPIQVPGGNDLQSIHTTCKFLHQGWELKVGAMVPLKLRLRHMEKTIVALLVASAATKARFESTAGVLSDNYRDVCDVQRVRARCFLGLKALLYSYCPALHALGLLACECNWNGGTAFSTAGAKECIAMSNVLLMHIIPSHK